MDKAQYVQVAALSLIILGSFSFVSRTLQQNSYFQVAQVADSTSGPVAHYTFDDGGAQGKIGGAKEFDGVDDYVDIPDNLIRGQGAMTVSAWVKPNDLSGNSLVIVEDEGAGNDPIRFDWAHGTGSNEFKYRCAVGNDADTKATVFSTSQYTTSDWHHVACVYNSGVVTLYIDGNAGGQSSPISGNISSTGSGFNIGDNAGGDTWNGLLDDIRIYSRALSGNEVADLYTAGGGTIVPPPQSPPPTQTPTEPQSPTNPAPVNTSGIYYVDQNNPQASDSNPGSEESPLKTIRAAASRLQTGNVIYIKNGTYQNNESLCSGSTCTFIKISASNITIKPYPGHRVVIRGMGFSDVDQNGDGYADGPTNPSKREILLQITGNNVQLSDLEFTNSLGSGIEIDGNDNRIENVISHDNWSTGLQIGRGTTGRVAGNIVRYSEFYRNRRSNGVIINRPDSPVDVATNNTIEYSLSYENGRDANGNRVLPVPSDPAGGGNSDGIGSSKYCSDEPPVNGITNFCPNNVFRGNVVYRNTDDGFDVSFADSIFENNISFGNGSASGGGKGYKILRDIPRLTFTNNIAYANVDRGFDLRVIGLKFFNNYSIGNGAQGVIGIKTDSIAQNNIAYQNGMNDFVVPSGCAGCFNNWAEDWGANQSVPAPTIPNPNIFKSGGTISVSLPTGTVAQKVEWLQNQFKSAFGISGGSTPVVNPPPTSPVVGDITGDGKVNTFDFSEMNRVWNTSDSRCDLNKDGMVNTLDYSILVRNWTG